MHPLRALRCSVVLLGAACARPGPGAAPEGDSPSALNAEVSIVIRNHNYLDIVVYLVRGGHDERLGSVSGLSNKIFPLPWRRVEAQGTLRLAADPLGQNRRIQTELLLVRPSSIVEWTIEAALNQSTAVVR